MNSMVEFTSSPTELEAVINLRYRVLRAPWNQSLETARDELEHLSFNAFIRSAGGQVIACGRLQLNSPDTGQIRYMAVENQEQGKGYGAAILRALELKAQSLGLRKIELQARENALAFYLSHAYRIAEKSFKLWDQIQHFKMVKDL